MPKPPVTRQVAPLTTGWRLTKHARERARELGYTFAEVVLCADQPELTYTQTDYGPDECVHKRGDIACVVNLHSRVVVTVLLPLVDEWEHGRHTRADTGPVRLSEALTEPDPSQDTTEPPKAVRRAHSVSQARMSGALQSALWLSKHANTPRAREWWGQRAKALLDEERPQP